MSDLVSLEPFRDTRGRLKAWPVKERLQRAAVALIADCFEDGREYSWQEVRAILDEQHTFGDWALLRRLLYDWGYLDRDPAGQRYWKRRSGDGTSP